MCRSAQHPAPAESAVQHRTVPHLALALNPPSCSMQTQVRQEEVKRRLVCQIVLQPPHSPSSSLFFLGPCPSPLTWGISESGWMGDLLRAALAREGGRVVVQDKHQLMRGRPICGFPLRVVEALMLGGARIRSRMISHRRFLTRDLADTLLWVVEDVAQVRH